MRTLLVAASLIVALVAFGSPFLSTISGSKGSAARVDSASARESGSGGFPKAGVYDIVNERPDGREETDMWVDVSNRQAFEAMVARDDGSNCRDRNVSIGGGSFSVRVTCDAPDGDIHNIRIERRGTYSEDSIEMTTDTYLWGQPIRWVTRYRLRNG